MFPLFKIGFSSTVLVNQNISLTIRDNITIKFRKTHIGHIFQNLQNIY